MLVGKPVVSIFDGKMIGIINNVLFDGKFSKIEWIQLFDDNDDFECVISTKNICSIDDVVMIKNCDCVLNASTVDIEPRNPTNYSVFSMIGKNYGMQFLELV